MGGNSKDEGDDKIEVISEYNIHSCSYYSNPQAYNSLASCDVTLPGYVYFYVYIDRYQCPIYR